MNEPTKRGWYRTVESSNWMLYALDETDHWNAYMLNGDASRVPFSYVEQGGPIELIADYPHEGD